MRRGLISRDSEELPDAVLDARLGRVRAAMQQAQLDALIVYTNNTRPAGVSWLTAFVPYWSEALLVVPRDGAPYLVAALSFRVKTWIERVSRVGEVLHTPRVGLKAAQQIAAARADAIVGIVDFDDLLAGIVEDLRESGPKLTLRDASDLFAKLRSKADTAEIALAKKAAAMAHRALAVAHGDTLGERISGVEREARFLGAEEIYIAAAPDLASDGRLKRIEGDAALGKSFALRATLAYKGTWIRLVRAFCEREIAAEAAVRLAQAVAPLPAARGFSGFSSWLVEGCRTSQPLEALMGSRLDAVKAPILSSIVSVQGSLVIDGHTVLVGAPALVGERGEAASLLIDPVFG
jgi:hypothetical protein